MSTLISTAKDLRAGQTPETMLLFLTAERMTIEIGHNVKSLYRFKNEIEPMPLLRHCLSYVLRNDYKWTFTAIGKVFSSDHCSPLYGYRTAKNLLEINDPLAVRFVTKLSMTYGTNTKKASAKCIPCRCTPSQGPKVS